MKLTYKQAVVGQLGGKDPERKSIHSPVLCRDEKSIGAIMNGVRSDPNVAQPYTPGTIQLPGVKWTGHQNLESDINVKMGLAEKLQEGSNQMHRGGGKEGKSPPWEGKSKPWEGKKRTWSRNSQREQRRIIEQGFGRKEHDASSVTNNDSKEQDACMTRNEPQQKLTADMAVGTLSTTDSSVIKETRSGCSTTSSLTKYIAASGSGRALSTPMEITETGLPAGCSTIGGTERNFIPPQNKGSHHVFERSQCERKGIPVVSAKSLENAEEKSWSSSSGQNVSAGLRSWPIFPNKKTVYFFPKTLNLPNYAFDMVYYQDPGKFCQQIW